MVCIIIKFFQIALLNVQVTCDILHDFSDNYTYGMNLKLDTVVISHVSKQRDNFYRNKGNIYQNARQM